jgi:hypothetical protein
MTTGPLIEAMLSALCLWIVHHKLTRGLDQQIAEMRRTGASGNAVRLVRWTYCVLLWTLTAALGWMLAAALVKLAIGRIAW